MKFLFKVFKINKSKHSRTYLLKEIDKILSFYMNHKTYENMNKGVNAMLRLSSKFPNEWLPNYCVSYFYTLLTSKPDTFNSINSNHNISKAQKNLNIAFEKAKNEQPETLSDFHVLQSLIHYMNYCYSSDKNLKTEYLKKRAIEIEQALSKNPNNLILEAITNLNYRKNI